LDVSGHSTSIVADTWSWFEARFMYVCEVI
jgi:hypothetical protein